MKNIDIYDGNAFDFHKDVIKSKRNSEDYPDIRNQLTAFSDKIETQYTLFDTHFDLDTLQDLNNVAFSIPEKDLLKKLYNYNQKIFSKLKVKLTTVSGGIRNSTCQNCTIGEVNSFDHFIPKNEFVEFVVNPKNLFPSCTNCNSIKGSTWRNRTKRVFLNLYLDKLPEEQYLFVRFNTVTNGRIDFSFYLDNRTGISPVLFEMIEHHYHNLNLFQRFRENSDSVITELQNSITAALQYDNFNRIKKVSLDKLELDKKNFGHNYWEVILQIALLNNQDFENTFIN